MATRARANPAGARAFAVLAWGLSFHILLMVLFFAQGLEVEQLRAVAAWKELLALALVCAAVVRIATGRVDGFTVRASDLFAATVVAFTLIHAGAAGAGLGAIDEPAEIALGVRDLVFGFALYAVGRTTPGLGDDPRLLRRFFVIGAVTSVIGVLEWLFVEPEHLVVLGVANYFNDFLGVTLFTRGNLYGLPDNYWTMVGGRLVQRAGSVYMSSQGFAIPFLLILPAATV